MCTLLDNNLVKLNSEFEKTAFDNGIHMFRVNDHTNF